MDRGEIEIEEVQKEDDCAEKRGWTATGAAILRRGWWLGKRVAIVGAAITSVPVVIPPVIVLSTLGLVVSFPFVIYFAGYACADKVMSTLLPLPPSKQQMQSVDSGEMGFDAFLGEKPVDEIARETETSEKGEILEIEMGLGSTSGKGRALVQVGIEEENEVVDFKPVKKVGEKEKAVEEEVVKGVKGRSDTTAEAGEPRKSDDAISAQVVEKGVEHKREVQETASESTGALKSPYTVAVLAPTVDNIRENEPPNLSSEHLSIVELRGKEKANDNFEQVEANEGLKEQMEEGGEEKKDTVEEMLKGVKVMSDTTAEAREPRKSDDVGSAQGVEKGVEQEREVQEPASESNGALKSPHTVAVLAPTEDNIRENEPPNLSSEHLSIVELRGKEKANDNFEQVEANEGLKEQTEDGGEEKKISSSASDVVTEDKGLPEGLKTQVEPTLLNSQHVLSTEIASSKKADTENLEHVGSTEHRDLAKCGPDTVVTVVSVTSVHSDEISSEEELWDQLLAMRTIVGYKATLHSSLWEELRALYLLTGVEPPVSLKEAADHEEISKNLQFLKAVVGVK